MITTKKLYSRTFFRKNELDFLHPIKVHDENLTFCFRLNNFLKRINGVSKERTILVKCGTDKAFIND